MMKFETTNTPGYVALHDEGGALVTGYQFDHFNYQPFCHPVTLAGSIPLTMINPGDHPWHNGMYFSWKHLNGCNVWDFEASGGRSGQVEHVSLDLNPDRPALTHVIEWSDDEGTALLRDTRTLTVTPLAEDPFHYAYDWHFHFEALVPEVVCDADKQWGNYAGLGIRFARGSANTVMNAEGEQDWPENWNDPDRYESRWTAYAVSLDGLPSRACHSNWGGVALFDHPSNPRHPTPWLTYDQINMQKIMAAFLKKEPYVFRQGEQLDLRYRAVPFRGQPKHVDLEAQWQAWAGSPILQPLAIG